MNQKKFKFTIITVVKNDYKNITKTINSVFCQKKVNFEYIIVDGYSKDTTYLRCQYFKKNIWKDIIIFRNKDNSFYESLNFAIKKSKGEYIGILNSGDVYSDKSCLLEIEKKINLKPDFVFAKVLFKKNKKIVRKWSFKKFDINKFNFFKIPHPTLFVKRKIFYQIGLYSLKYKISSDTDFILKLIRKYKKFFFIDKYFICMEVGGISTNPLFFRKKFLEDLSILKKNYKYTFIIIYFLKIISKIPGFIFHK